MIVAVIAFFSHGANDLILELLQHLKRFRLPLLNLENARAGNDVSCQRNSRAAALTSRLIRIGVVVVAGVVSHTCS